MHRIPREKDVEQWARNEAKKRGYRLVKWTSPAQRGVPDRILLGPDGLIVFLEFKRPGGKLTPLQELWRKWLVNNEHPYHMVDSKEAFKALLDAQL